MSARPIVTTLERIPVELQEIRAGFGGSASSRLALAYLLGVTETRLAHASGLFGSSEPMQRFQPHKRMEVEILQASADSIAKAAKHLLRILPPTAEHRDHAYRSAESQVCGPCFDLCGYSASGAMTEAWGLARGVGDQTWCTVCRLRTTSGTERCGVCAVYRSSHVRERPRLIDSRLLKALR